MKKKFKQSYKLGISAGILTGMINALIASFLYFILPLESLKSLSWPTFIFAGLLSSTIWMIIISALFIKLINKLPSNKILIKFFILYLIANIITSPISLITYREIIGIFILLSILDIIIIPLIYSSFYMLLAQKTKIAKITTARFTILILLLLFILFIPAVVFMSIDVIKQLPFTKEINETEVEQKIFTLVNQKREELGNNPLVWNNKIYTVAKEYSTQLAENNATFSHISETGDTIHDRIKKENLFFFIAGENLYLAPKTENMSELIFDGWMKSPGHRSLLIDRDQFFTDGAVGVKCNFLICYATLNMIDSEEHFEYVIQEYQYFYRNLNDPAFGLGPSYPIEITIKADKPIDIYFFHSLKHLKLFADYGEDNSYKRSLSTKEFSINTDAESDKYIMVINTNPTSAAFEYTAVYN